MASTIHRIGRVYVYDNDTPAYAPDVLPFRRAMGVPKKGSAAWYDYMASQQPTRQQSHFTSTNAGTNNTDSTDIACLGIEQQRLIDTVRNNTEYLVDRICAVHHPDVTVLGVTAGMDIDHGVLAVDIALSSAYPAIGTVTLHGITADTTTRECVDSICSAVTTHLLKQ